MIPKLLSKDRKIATERRASERGRSMYPTPRSHESHSKRYEPTTPPSPAAARTKNPPSAMQKIPDPPRNTSLLTRLPKLISSGSSRRCFLPLRCFSFINDIIALRSQGHAFAGSLSPPAGGALPLGSSACETPCKSIALTRFLDATCQCEYHLARRRVLYIIPGDSCMGRMSPQ